jgi:golgi-specific brefeldin A-resistance guanine nucleotide exchange factor 1
MSNPEAAVLTFSMISRMISDTGEPQVTADNFFGIVTVLDDFAALAGFIVDNQRQARRREPPLTSTTYAFLDFKRL